MRGEDIDPPSFLFTKKFKTMEATKKIKKVEMTIREFMNFRKIALAKRVKFNCIYIKGGGYEVTCESDFMELIGY